jgi:hypothetical protein
VAKAAIPVLIEVIVLAELGEHRGNALGFRTARRQLTCDLEPDRAAREACGFLPDSDGLLHSTSWRYEDRQVVLTYVALPDPVTSARHEPVGETVATGDDAMRPSPAPKLCDVAAHACRHLAFLAATDRQVRTALDRHPRLSRHLRRYDPDVAGELTDNI